MPFVISETNESSVMIREPAYVMRKGTVASLFFENIDLLITTELQDTLFADLL